MNSPHKLIQEDVANESSAQASTREAKEEGKWYMLQYLDWKVTNSQWPQFKSIYQRCGSVQDNIVDYIYDEFKLNVRIKLYVFLH
jgi:hypothetical protein